MSRPQTVCATAHVPAPIDRLFAVLTDAARMSEWLPGCGGAVSDEPLASGVHLRVRFGQRVTEFVILDFTPPYRFGWAERGRRNGWSVRFHLDAAGGETALTVCEVWAPMSLIAWVRGSLLRHRRPERHVELILANLRSIAA